MAVRRPGPRTRRTLARQGLVIRTVMPLAGSHRGHVLRATLLDGTEVRLRRYRDEAAAARVHQCLQLAGPGTLPVPLGRAGCWLATAFVEGHPIDARTGRSAASRWMTPAAALLARIHASRRPRHTAPPISEYSRAISLAAGRLVRGGHVTPDLVGRLRALPTPARAPAALTHGDFSPDNLIVTASGELAVVDEERVMVRPVAYDLARAVCLWALDLAAERRFLTAYGRAGGEAGSFVASRDFWIAAALSTSVLYRLRYRPAALPPVVAALCAL